MSDKLISYIEALQIDVDEQVLVNNYVKESGRRFSFPVESRKP
jgi:hypothetical protein